MLSCVCGFVSGRSVKLLKLRTLDLVKFVSVYFCGGAGGKIVGYARAYQPVE